MKRASMEGQASCGHSSSQPATSMDPAVWGSLPDDLLQLVFARLEVPQINRLRFLSKAWLRNMESADSKFRRLCAESHPRLFALITERDTGYYEEDNYGKHPVHVYDIKSNAWHSFEINVCDYCKRFSTMGASDGGLVCFVCTCLGRDCRLILVCNPLTHDLRELPEHTFKGQIGMVQLVMDRNTKSYKVIIVGVNSRGVVAAALYDSETDVWTSTNLSSELIFGLSYRWEVPPAIDGPSAYDCAKGRLVELNLDRPKLQGVQNVHNYALVKDHLFVLHRDKQRKRYVISELQGLKCAPYWTKLKDHDCGKWGSRSKSHDWLALLACKGFLLVYAGKQEHWPEKPHLDARLYDLSNCKWHALPNLPGERSWVKQEWMCELQWDAVP